MHMRHVFPDLAKADTAYTNYRHDPNKSLSGNIHAQEALLPQYQPPDHAQIAELAYILWESYGKDADTNWFAAERIFETGWSYELRVIREVALSEGLRRDTHARLMSERRASTETVRNG